jgi:hypothetical protein
MGVNQVLTREEVEALLQAIREQTQGLDRAPASGVTRKAASGAGLSGGFRVRRHAPRFLGPREGSGSVS